MDSIGALILFVIGLVLYFLPSFIAANRNTVNRGSVLVINLFLGWTFIGWVISLAMACSNNLEPKKV